MLVLKACYPKIPHQRNSTDCGLFLLSYVYHFCVNPPNLPVSLYLLYLLFYFILLFIIFYFIYFILSILLFY